MAAFRFRLGRLARVREIQERTARNLWAASEEVARNHQEVVEHGESEVRRACETLAVAQAEEDMSIHDVLRTQDLIEQLRKRLEVARQRASSSRFQADQLREAWQAAKADARALERLEERERERHHVEERKLDNARMDEVALARSLMPAGGRDSNEESDR